MGFEKIVSEGVTLYKVDEMCNAKVSAFFTTRYGGVTKGDLGEMNFSVVRGDTRSNVTKNVELFAKAIDADYDNIIFSRQIHTDNVYEVEDKDFYKYYQNDEPMERADALITNRKNVTLTKFSADCTIIYLYDPINEAIGLVHSGWKSTVMNITGKTVYKMTKAYNTNPKDLICAIGPCIHECCFEVGDEVAEEFDKVFDRSDKVVSTDYEKAHVNLPRAVKLQLLRSSVKESNIIDADICTACNKHEFHSHRARKGKCGLSVGAIQLKNNI